jgi:hypothetical protein
MNGYEAKGLNEDAFGDKGKLSGLKTFDAFRKFTNTSPRCRNKEQARNKPLTQHNTCFYTLITSNSSRNWQIELILPISHS